MSGSGFAWQALRDRHLASLTRQEFTRAVRALSMRYVERRAQLPERSPLDTAGKRAAFALFYAPLHWLTVQAAVRHLSLTTRPLTRIIDLGCGTGVCSAAWALALPAPAPALEGADLHPWAVDETRWTWRTAGLTGKATRGDAVALLDAVVRRRTAMTDTGIIAGWSLNELDDAARLRVQTALTTATASGATTLIFEPLARGIAPWWSTWTTGFPAEVSVTADDFKSDEPLPDWLADFAKSAGLSPVLGARVCVIRPTL